MATTTNISSNKYVNITSTVGGSDAVSGRELILRLITTNELFPTGSVLEFSSKSALSAYLVGTTSEEYLQASQYLDSIDKSGNSPSSIQFARWADVDTSAQVFGSAAASLDTLKTYTAAALDVTLDGSTQSITGLDFSAATSYAEVATEIETEVNLLTGFASATVTYNSGRKGFILDTGGTADGAISFTEVTANFLKDLGWSSLAVYSDGIAAQSLTDMQTAATSISNNYGSFATVDQITMEESVELALWNTGYNVAFQYYPRCELSEASDWYDELIAYSGTGLHGYDPLETTEYPWLHPSAELATMDFDDPGAMKNFMFTRNSVISPLITTDAAKETYDALQLNYFGRTQEAGTELTFYQKGVLMGDSTDPVQMGVYAGEQWVKSELKAQFLSMFLAIPIIAADDTGVAIVNSYLDATAEQAISNGVFSVGKALTTTNKAYITQITGDSRAWQAVQRDGYYYSSKADATEEEISYNLIYATRIGVNFIDGTHNLI